MEKLKPLKPCPFCKGTAKRKGRTYSGKFLGMDQNNQPIYEQLKWYAVKCAACGIEQPKRTYHTRQESDDAWNNRA